MKKVKLEIEIDGDEIAFAIYKSKDLSRTEILGALKVVSAEILGDLRSALKIRPSP